MQFPANFQELNETENGVLQSLEWLDGVLKGDYKNIVNLKEKSKARLQALRDAALLEEQEYSIIEQAQVNVLCIIFVIDQAQGSILNSLVLIVGEW